MVANTLPTESKPAQTVFLQHLPPEIVEAIGTAAHPKDARALASTCRQLESQLKRAIWSRVLIKGTESDLMRKLGVLKPSASKNRETLKLIKKARFIVDGRDLYATDSQGHTAEVRPDAELPKTIVRAIKKMTLLKSLALDVERLASWQLMDLSLRLRKVSGLKVEHLGFMTQERMADIEFVRNISADHLKALHLCVGIDTWAFDLAAKHLKQLESLCLCLNPREPKWLSRSMNAEVATTIANAFSQLKCLIICESESSQLQRLAERVLSHPSGTRQEVVQKVVGLANVLNTLPYLQRFACTLSPIRLLRTGFVPNISSDKDLDASLRELVCMIKGTHPKLDEVAIVTTGPQFYLWNRGVTSLESRDEMHNPDSFPFGLT